MIRYRAPMGEMRHAAATENARARIATLAIAWIIAVGAVVAVRYRGDWEAYRALHRWCAANGAPEWLRNLDSLLLFVAAAWCGAWIIGRVTAMSTTSLLRLQRGHSGWGRMVVVALAPMVVGGGVLALVRGPSRVTLDDVLPRFVSGVVRAPIAEEFLFRGLLVGACAAAIGWRGVRFWANAVAAALLFAAIHISWSADGVVNGWPTLLMTGLGGVWYAWLLGRWGTLVVPIALHAGMNLGWLLAGASGGAGGGGLIENLLRVATIVIATWWTIRRTKHAVAT